MRPNEASCPYYEFIATGPVEARTINLVGKTICWIGSLVSFCGDVYYGCFACGCHLFGVTEATFAAVEALRTRQSIIIESPLP